MTRIWLDEQLPAHFAQWISLTWGFEAAALEDVGPLHAKDSDIFARASAASAILLTKDSDFSLMSRAWRSGAKIVWLRCGNVTNARLKEILGSTLSAAVERIEGGESVVEIWARGPYRSYFASTRQLFWPPKPKLFFNATRTFTLRATFGT